MKRGSFLKSILAMLVSLFTFKSVEAEPVDEPVLYHQLWPNIKPFMCEGPPHDHDCKACRRVYNEHIIATGPKWYSNVCIDSVTGHWSVT